LPWIGLKLLNALSLTLQVFAVQLALTAVLDISGNTGDLWRLVQPVMLLAGLTAVTAVIASVQVGLGRYAAEEVRAFGLARNFGTRLNTLDADYLVILLSTSGTGRGSVWPAALALPFHWR
jgi:hypothetical protein